MKNAENPGQGELIKVFGYGKALVVLLAIFGVVLLALAGVVIALKALLPAEGQRIYDLAVALLVVLAVGLFGLAVWQAKLRAGSYAVHEHGIVRIHGGQRRYTAFAEIEDLYLFSSGQTAMAGLVTNVAYRRTAAEPFCWVNGHLKNVLEFQLLVRELYVRERQPVIMEVLNAGGAVTFNYISTAQVWQKRMSGRFLDVSTQPLTLSCSALVVGGQTVALSSLRSVDVNEWTEKVVIKDAAGQVVLSTLALGIISADVFFNTLHVLRGRNGTTPATMAARGMRQQR